MARYDNDPFGVGGPEVYAAQYLKWKKIILPSGQIVYEVPGNPGYVYDPVASRATGRAVFRSNPQQEISAQQAEQDAIDKQRKLAEDQASPVGQLAPMAAGIGGLVLANHLTQATTPAKAIGMTSNGVLMSDGSILGAGGSAAPAASAATQGALGSAAPTAGIPGAPAGVSAQMVPLGTEAGAVPATEGAGILANAASMGPVAGIAVPAAVIGSTILGGKAAIDMAQGKKPGLPGRIILGMATGGLSEFANGFFGGHKSVAETQNDRLRDIEGITGAPTDLGEFGLSTADLVARETAKGGNVDFAKTRDENFLKVDDTIGGVQNFEVVGNDYMGKWDDAARRRYNQLNLDAKNIDERKGGLYYKDKDLASQLKQQVDQEFGFDVSPSAIAANAAFTPPTLTEEQIAKARPVPQMGRR